MNINKNNLNKSDSLFFRIEPIDLYFLADNIQKTQLFETAYAFKCDNGYGGMKYEVIKIEITSDSDFNDQFLTNTLLNDLVTVKKGNISNKFDHIKLNDVDLSEIIWSELYIVDHPTISKEHIFSIKLFKSDGVVISIQSEKIIWQ